MVAKKTLMVGSGKGGVGKSTVAVNLAIAFAQKGYSVGLLDADLYGPSIPIMLGLRRLSPPTEIDEKGNKILLPFTKFGIKTISLGFFMEEARSVIWRGPMLHSTLQKMIENVRWGDLDLLIIDLPPGTGDIPLSLSQILKIDGALVVCTPQDVAVVDAVKAINAFHQLEIPLFGIVENMAGFTVPGTGETYAIFGEGKGKELAHRFDTKLLGSIPIETAIRLSSDEGYPCAFHQGHDHVGKHFVRLSDTLWEKIFQLNANPFTR